MMRNGIKKKERMIKTKTIEVPIFFFMMTLLYYTSFGYRLLRNMLEHGTINIIIICVLHSDK